MFQLIVKGMQLVTELEQDLKVANVICMVRLPSKHLTSKNSLKSYGLILFLVECLLRCLACCLNH